MKSDFVLEMERAFSRELPGVELFAFDKVGSTSDKAREYALLGKKENAFFVAREQTAGRGRRGRSFISREGGLYISYLLHPRLTSREAIMLTVFSATALAQTVEELTGAKPGIKWVNDLFLGGKKLAGILAEGGFSPDGEGFEYAVVGIGVNLHGKTLDREIENIATTLESETGIRVNIAEFAARLSKKLSAFEESLADSYMQSYRARSAVLGKRVKITSAGEEFFCEALSIEDDGALRVKLDTGEEKRLYSAEVSCKL